MYISRRVLSQLRAAIFWVALMGVFYARSAAQEKETSTATTDAPSHGQANEGVVENSVVKVFSTVRYPDTTKPWTKQAPSEFTGSGVVIEGKRILSNAHLVEYASQ